MTLQDYLKKKTLQQNLTPQYRSICRSCNQPDFSCFCQHIKKFDSKISFVILIHPIEASRRIATGRMSHLCLEDSYLIKGQNYSDESKVSELLNDKNYESVILYPGPTSKNLSLMTSSDKVKLFKNQFDQNKKLRIFVIDGTWATARKMIRQSENIKKLPRICFSSEKPSTFRVRKQPKAGCFSTIEAIYHTIELLSEQNGYSLASRQHDNLLTVFDSMVETQLKFINEANLNLRQASYRRESQIKSA